MDRATARRWTAAAVVALAAMGPAACASDGGSATGSSGTQAPDGTVAPAGEPRAETPEVARGPAFAAEAPTALAVRPGDDHLWLAERAGTVRRLTVSEGGALASEGDAVLDLTDQTTTDSERGLLGIAFSADGDQLFVSYTDLQGDSRLVSYDISADAVDESSRKVLLAVDQPYSNHNGGHVVLGPDGDLWFGLGDGGSADDPENRAQDPDVLLGKMVRIDPTGDGEPEAVLSGLRNPWRFSFDRDGSLWIGDVGQNRWEEIDHLAADDIVGANLGWSGREGTHANENASADGRTGTDPVDPVFEYPHEAGNCSITAGFVYHGTAIDGLEGSFLFADYCKGDLRAIRLGADGRLGSEYDLGVHVDEPVSFAADTAGEPYVLSARGEIVRIVPAG